MARLVTMRSWVKSWCQPLAEMQGKAAYKKTQVVGLFPGPCASGSYMHRAALFIDAEAEANTMISAHATLQKHG